MPGIILQTSEFDYLRRETHLIIPKLKEAGVYVDHMDYAGEAHGFHVILAVSKADLFFNDWSKAIQKYVL